MHNNFRKQSGAALLIMMLVLILTASIFMVTRFDNQSLKIERDRKTAEILAQTKSALLGYTLATKIGGSRPGNMPFPDRLSEATPPNYDGETDNCEVLKGEGERICLGRLPWRTLGLNIVASSQADILGFVPWYAVSANLNELTCLNVLNSEILNRQYKDNKDCSGADLRYPWLTVRDMNGNVISNRVAVVIIIPGLPLNGQLRLDLPNLGGAEQYLDHYIVPEKCYKPCIPGVYSNADLDNDFIQSPEFSRKNSFNDSLLFITIDELINFIELRVAKEAKRALLKYHKQNGRFPDAASIGYKNGKSALLGNNFGFLPLPPYALRCSGTKCDSNFEAIVKFYSDKNYISSTGKCSFNMKVCECLGSGSCLRLSSSIRTFICDSLGSCYSNIQGQFEYEPISTFNLSNYESKKSCQIINPKIICNGPGHIEEKINNSDYLAYEDMPEWFFDNQWNHFIFYAKGELSVGRRKAKSVVVNVGRAINYQKRPSNSIGDYLENPEAISDFGESAFNSAGIKKTNTYNDQILIVRD